MSREALTEAVAALSQSLAREGRYRTSAGAAQISVALAASAPWGELQGFLPIARAALHEVWTLSNGQAHPDAAQRWEKVSDAHDYLQRVLR